MGQSLTWLVRLTNTLLVASVLFILWRLSEVWVPYVIKTGKVLIPFLIALVITYLLHPLIEFLRRAGVSRTLSVASIYLLFFSVAGYAIYRGLPYVFQQVEDFTEQIPMLTKTYRELISLVIDHTEHYPVEVQQRLWSIISWGEEWASSFLESILSSAQRHLGDIFLFFMVPFIVFYLLKDYPKCKEAMLTLIPKRWRKEGIDFLKDVNLSLGSYIRGQLIVCGAVGILASIGFWLIQLQFPIILGLAAAITNLIPYVGPFIGAVPALGVAMMDSGTQALLAIAVIFGIQVVESNILSPLVVGKSLHMHPVVIIFVLLLAGEWFGLLGMVFAIPVAAIVRIIYNHARDSWA
ncbi:AI-2E family transporter [Bacillaceae bacterium SIJ1]|uniref:AI-2E family transporter n=1 Tax=Litoribacterium kuwaitense TaxID=1398745 RepID=UPI0013ECA761|nr:AI-2E family transporter [Litoribacterium kuwaitense]NGP43457.1 AI-2E family transporter [Litoribacterium kuwaitense]